MKVKLSQIYRAEPVVRKLTGQQMPIRTAYRIHKAIQNLRDEYVRIEQLRMDLVKKHGEEKEQKLQVKEENVLEFAKEFGKLLEEEIDIEFDYIDINSLPESLQITVQDLDAISFLLKPDTEELKSTDKDLHYPG